MKINWDKISEKSIEKSKWRKMIRRKFAFPNGKAVDFDLKKEGPFVCILAITKNNKVILAKQFRPGPEKILLELPGGYIDKGETPANAAKRELLEETGYIGKIKFIGKSLDDAYSTLIRYNFVATNCIKKDVKNIKKDQNEFIKIVEMPIKKFRQHLQSGMLTDIEVGYLGLDFLKLL
ncbi:MAG: NUDIX hydrolase [Patescibacteria group bacterium]|jgi:ADP-ribose pyrophosphatase